MALLRKMSGLRAAMTVWHAVRPGLRHPSGAWFGQTFIAAATVVVERWGPRWAKKRVGAQVSIGAWILFAVWIAGAIVFIWKLW